MTHHRYHPGASWTCPVAESLEEDSSRRVFQTVPDEVAVVLYPPSLTGDYHSLVVGGGEEEEGEIPECKI